MIHMPQCINGNAPYLVIFGSAYGVDLKGQLTLVMWEALINHFLKLLKLAVLQGILLVIVQAAMLSD